LDRRRGGKEMKLFIETPALEIREKLVRKRAFIEEEPEGLVLKEILSITPSSVGIRIIFRTNPSQVPDEIEITNLDFRLMHLFVN
jgi:hypothetical protein